MSWNVNLADMMLQESIGEFYRKISEMRTGTRLKWSLVKEKLLRHLAVSRVTKVETKEKNAWRPMGFWVKKGFPAKKIRANAAKKPCRIFGTVYQLHLETTSSTDSFRYAEKLLSKSMQKVKDRKARQVHACMLFFVQPIETCSPAGRFAGAGEGPGTSPNQAICLPVIRVR